MRRTRLLSSAGKSSCAAAAADAMPAAPFAVWISFAFPSRSVSL
jgi:hypothetical protein